jgi:KEOPS complex subunit Cgi121
VCGREHIESALEHARRAFRNGNNSSSDLTLETMLYASGEKQLAKARDKMGLKAGTEQFALLFLGAGPDDECLKHLGLHRDDPVLEFSLQKAMNFGIGQDELASVPEHMARDLVLERVAFVDVIKR